MTGAPGPPPITLGVKLSYGVGQLAEGLKNGALNTFLIFYYSQVLGMPAALAGLAVGTSLLIDAVVDPLAGSLSDNFRSRFGRRHPFMLAAMVPMATCFYLLFSPPSWRGWPLFLWLILWVNLARTALTVYFVPHLALGAELSEDFDERVSLVGFRMFFNIIGGFAAQMIGFQFFFATSLRYPVGQLNPHAYAPFAVTLGLLMMLSIGSAVLGTRRFIPFLTQPGPSTRLNLLGALLRTARDMRDALRHHSFAWLFGGVLLVYLTIGTNVALQVYMYTYFWELTSGQVVVLTMAYPIGAACGLLVAPKFQNRFGKRGALLFGTAWWAGLQVLPVMLRLGNLFPRNGSSMLEALLVLFGILQGTGAVQANVAFGAALADVADESELLNGRRQEGIFFAASAFSFKLASGVGSLMAGVALAVIGWPDGTAIRTAADVSPAKIWDLGLVYGPLVIGFTLVTMWCYSHYRLTREKHTQIIADLARRRSSRSATTQR